MSATDAEATLEARTFFDRPRLEPAPEALVTEIRYVDQHPVLVVDGVLPDPHYVRRLALELRYHHRQGNYPGHFAFVSLSMATFRDLVNRLYAEAIGHQLRLHTYYRDLTFAVIDQPGDTLNPRQRQPHYDDFCDYAGILYLNLPEQCSGGTSFWRHRRTGLIAAPVKGDELRFAETFVVNGVATSEEMTRLCMDEAVADPAEGYLTESTPYWELVDRVAMKQNRLVVYPSRLFHLPDYQEELFGSSLAARRLTMNLYFDRA
jgi:hypothetical protein